MDDKKLQDILNKIDIPAPDESARKRVISAALQEFKKKESVEQKKFKGFSLLSRLIDKLTTNRRRTMKKSIAITGGLVATAAMALLMFNLTQDTLKKTQPGPASLPYSKETIVVAKSITPAETGPADSEPAKTIPVETAPPKQEPAIPAPAKKPAEPIPQTRQDAPIKKSKVLNEDARSTRRLAPEKRKGVLKVLKASPRSTASRAKDQEAIMADNFSTAKRSFSFEANRGQRIQSYTSPKPEPIVGGNVYVGRDKFEKVAANPVKLVSEEPVSTFSIDVDTASYAFVRRAINSGTLPQKNAVRIEELINYFDYDYELPEDKSKPFKPTVAVYQTPWNPDTKLLHIGIKGYDIVTEKKPRSNLVFLIDTSGSMGSPDKLPLLKSSFRMLVESLNPEDTVAIVVYAGSAGKVLEPTKVKEKGKILEALEKLRSGGSTAGGAGIRLAYALAEANFDKNSVNRVILATDGDFNVGITNQEELKGFVERKRKTGIYLSVLGFGQGNYNDALMQKLAQNGNGNASYIDSLSEAQKVLVDEASSTLFTIAKDVKIQIEFNPTAVAEYRLIGYETRMLKREDFKNDQVDAGDIGSGHSVTAIYEITPPKSKARLIDELRYKKAPSAVSKPQQEKGSEYAFLKIRYKLPDSDKSILLTTPITDKSEYTELNTVPGDIRFAAAVATFGQLLRGDPYLKNFTFDDIIELAEPVRGRDKFGYRNEFLRLVRLAKSVPAMKTQ